VLLVQEFDRNFATKRHIGGPVDLPHAADAKALLQQVLPTDEIALALAFFFRSLARHFNCRL
jgi:hypothetical protein